MPNPGLIFVTSKTKYPSDLPDELYNQFCDEEHIPNLLDFFKHERNITRPLALRYKNTKPESDRPHLALFPVPDSQWIFSPNEAEFLQSSEKSRILGVDNIYEHIDFELRPYEKIQTFEGYNHASKSGLERCKTLGDFEDWYRKQHLDMLSMCRGYRRTTRYKRVDGQRPRYLALHEYACEPDDLPAEQIKQVTETEWTQKILKESPIFDRDVFVLIGAQGETAEKL
ncbi:hypothetical protein LTR09_005564 [Extremus antarcticus]|uniref:Uncharacterized protein n=1 Tax=Extremus antarcticus TaxID=702011 RepID=A0AAJ0DN29_9PEZI|nr:hypothetical protein LTR09_005564 [Extremus antarcticus]